MLKKIMVIDDEPDLLLLVSCSLDNRGYEIFGGGDGREALALALRLMPDLMILDVNLPRMNGDEVARIFKNDEKMKHIPVVLISSVTEGLKEKAEKSGADAYLSKPFELEEFVALVKKFCEPARP